MKKLSIITICYNEPNLEKTCESIVNQTWQDFEWVVIDGGSNEQTQKIWNKYKHRIDKFISEPDNGIYDACNKGINLATGKYLNFMNAGDSFYYDDVLKNVFENKDYDDEVLYGNAKMDKICGPKVCYMFYPEELTKDFLFFGCLNHQSTFIRHDLFNKYGLYDKKFKIGADFEKWLTFVENDVNFKYLPYIIANYNVNGVSATSNNALIERNEIIKKHFSEKEQDIIKMKYNIKEDTTIFQQITDKIFSIKYDYFKLHKIITLCGLSIKIKNIKRNKKEKKKILFIGHAFHEKTQSSKFIIDLLKTEYNLTVFSFDPYNDTSEKFYELAGERFDNVILWQIMPSIAFLKKYILFDNIVFIPMYDATNNLNFPIWKEYKKCNIINFSKTLHEKCIDNGFHSNYIQFFPKPKNIDNFGKEKSVFLWQRTAEINPSTIENVLGIEFVDELRLHQVPDPCIKIIQPDVNWMGKDVKISTWFDSKQDMEDYMQKSAIYFAPRRLEGIGMSFLDAMAMGRCVIAPNNPTMNEYITHGVNGYLYDINNPQKILIKDVKKIQKQTLSFISSGYKYFEKEKYKIFDWININPHTLKIRWYFKFIKQQINKFKN